MQDFTTSHHYHYSFYSAAVLMDLPSLTRGPKEANTGSVLPGTLLLERLFLANTTSILYMNSHLVLQVMGERLWGMGRSRQTRQALQPRQDA